MNNKSIFIIYLIQMKYTKYHWSHLDFEDHARNN